MSELGLTTCDEQGAWFETGVPVTFRFVRNTEKSPYFGAQFQQDLEPAGRYMLHNENPGELARGWETGFVHFERPLVISFNIPRTSPHYDETSWKARLARVYGATGADLSRLLLADGWDGIVTVGEYEWQGKVSCDTREIVDLTPFLHVKNPSELPRRGRQLGPAKCSVRGCGRDHYARGWCMRHYTQWLKHGRVLKRKLWREDLAEDPEVCKAPLCLRDAMIEGYCRKHATQLRVHGGLTPRRELGIERHCKVSRCDQPHWARGYCMRHYNQNRWRWARRNPEGTGWAYHGSVADPLEILMHGIEVDERKKSLGRRSGVSVSTDSGRALWWGSMKRGDVRLYRAPLRALVRLEPENAWPADPSLDFTTDDVIPPTILEIYDEQEGTWSPFVDTFSEILWADDEARAEWEERWGPLDATANPIEACISPDDQPESVWLPSVEEQESVVATLGEAESKADEFLARAHEIERLASEARFAWFMKVFGPPAALHRRLNPGPVALHDLVRVDARLNADADFWIQRSGDEAYVGRPFKKTSRRFLEPETEAEWIERGLDIREGQRVARHGLDPRNHLGVTVLRTDLLLPDYLYYVAEYAWRAGLYKRLCHGTLALKHVGKNGVLTVLGLVLSSRRGS
jgi:hypothetical protein